MPDPVAVAVVASDVLFSRLLVRLLAAAGYAPLLLTAEEAAQTGALDGVGVLVLDLDSLTAPPIVAVPAVLLSSAPETVQWTGGRSVVVAKPMAVDEFLNAVAALLQGAADGRDQTAGQDAGQPG